MSINTTTDGQGVTFHCKDCGKEETYTWDEERDGDYKRWLDRVAMEFHFHYCPEHQERTGFARNH